MAASSSGKHAAPPHAGGAAALTFAALGIVFGDIGTSPLYAMKETFGGANDLPVDPDTVYGVLSTVFWAITIIVTTKYVLFIMRADNEGEGGIMALIALVQRLALRHRTKAVLVALGVFGAALFYGDGMITPAISVLSAVEGLEVVSPDLESLVLPITVTILTGLFAIQRFGTGTVGRLFGPVMALWFGSLAVFGLLQVLDDPGILRALSPSYSVAFFLDDPGTAFLSLGTIVLAVTGAEALYADMGHFGTSPIRRAWFLFVLPALVLNYLGQGALLLERPEAKEALFFELVPDGLLVPVVVLATLATVIAAQAVISGAFSVTRQAVSLGFLPPLRILHTSRESAGQIYVPGVNWGLYVVIVLLVVAFGSSTALASAYGIAVTGTLAIDTVLAFVVVRRGWGRPLPVVLAGAAGFLVVDLAFFGANVPKVPEGGWFPLLVGLAVFTVLMTWRRGRDVVTANREREEGPLLDFVQELEAADDPPVRVPGTAVFLTPNPQTTPLALRYNVEHNRVLHEQVVVVAVKTATVPHVTPEERLEVDDLLIPDDGIFLVTVTYGFQDDVDVPAALRLAEARGVPCDVDDASYFLSRITVRPTRAPGLARWRKALFVLLSRNANSRAHYFGLPEDRVVSLGGAIDL